MPSMLAADGELHLSGTARLKDIANDASVRSSYPVLALAASLADAHFTRGSLADSLAPATACRATSHGMDCALNGTSLCAAKDPSSDRHAIVDGGPCWWAYTSLTGVTLHALDAIVEFGDGERAATVQRVRLPSNSAHGFQHLICAPQGDQPGVAAICVAAVRRADGEVRLVLGGVSPRPYRVYTSVEEEAMAGGLDDDTIAGLAERALLDAETDPESAEKTDAAAALLRSAIREIAANSA